jgi:preprotein translocase subunit SecA
VTEIDHVIPAQGGMRELERQIALTLLDRTWRKYLADLDRARTPAGDQRRSHEVFHDMMHEVVENMIGYLFNVQVMPMTDEKS